MIGPIFGIRTFPGLPFIGETLEGLVLFGSWVWGEAGSGSDVDLLVILGDDVPVKRELYRRWGSERLTWNGHPVEPHLLHLPTQNRRPSGLWSEVAIDGVVLFERDFKVSRYLSWVRREIVAGRLIRKWTHGQPYWVGVA